MRSFSVYSRDSVKNLSHRDDGTIAQEAVLWRFSASPGSPWAVRLEIGRLIPRRVGGMQRFDARPEHYGNMMSTGAFR